MLKIKNILITLLMSLSMFAATAQARELGASQIKKMLGPYPTAGSVEEAHDFEILLNYQATRTEADCAAAASEVKANLKTFFGGANGLLTAHEVKHFSLRLKEGMIMTAYNAFLAKEMFKRPRPYKTHPEIKPCIKLSNTYAYPSGHTTLSRVYARVLGRIYPERSELFLKRADEIAMHRVLGGVHHPSDIAAGKILGDAIAAEIYEND